MSEVIRRTVADYYAARLRQYGETARGVDWNSEASQALRFEKLLGLCRGETGFSLLDWGCGYGALLDHLRRLSVSCRYTGFDLSTEMIERARAREGPEASFTAAEEGLSPHDFVVASGVFNVKLEVPLDDWRAYVFSVLEAMDARARRGFAFNLLSLYSDPDRRRDTLFYADPLELFDHCRRRFSARVALLHDYPLYEFTLLVRKEAV